MSCVDRGHLGSLHIDVPCQCNSDFQRTGHTYFLTRTKSGPGECSRPRRAHPFYLHEREEFVGDAKMEPRFDRVQGSRETDPLEPLAEGADHCAVRRGIGLEVLNRSHLDAVPSCHLSDARVLAGQVPQHQCNHHPFPPRRSVPLREDGSDLPGRKHWTGSNELVKLGFRDRHGRSDEKKEMNVPTCQAQFVPSHVEFPQYLLGLVWRHSRVGQCVSNRGGNENVGSHQGCQFPIEQKLNGTLDSLLVLDQFFVRKDVGEIGNG